MTLNQRDSKDVANSCITTTTETSQGALFCSELPRNQNKEGRGYVRAALPVTLLSFPCEHRH
jgi:hypothetical protein